MKIMLPGYLFIILMFIAVNLNAVETESVKEVCTEQIQKKDFDSNLSVRDKGFLKRFFLKIKEGTKKVYRKTKNRIKRIFSKRKSKKDRMKSSFKERNKNLFNILIFSIIFIAVASLIVLGSLFLYLNLGLILGLYLLYILGIGLVITGLVIGLIYFSNRYILKPRFRS